MQILSYLDFLDLNRIRTSSKFFLQCSEVRRLQENLFRAPFNQQILEANFKEDDTIQLHPALVSNLYRVKKEEIFWSDGEKGHPNLATTAGGFWIGNLEVNELSSLSYQNATNPPVNRIMFLDRAWDARTLRDCNENSVYYNLGEEGYYRWRGQPEPEDEFSVPSSITVWDILSGLRVDFFKQAECQMMCWDQRDADEWENWEREEEEEEEELAGKEESEDENPDEDWGSRWNWA